MSTLVSVALWGVIVIVGLAVGVGRLDAASRREAWQRIADGRRVLAVRERDLSAREDALAEQDDRRKRGEPPD
jgi:hypothetical protein